MRLVLFLSLFALAACAAPRPGGVDWFEYVADRKAAGYLRTETRPADAGYSAETLARNFALAVLNPENSPLGRPLPAIGDADRHVRRWSEPINFLVVADVDARQEKMDARVDAFMGRLSAITGHPSYKITRGKTPQSRQANLIIFYGSQWFMLGVPGGLRRALKADEDPDLQKFMDGFSRDFQAWRLAPSPCAGTIYSSYGEEETGPKGTILSAFVYIRSEIPDDLLQTCIEEELSQTLGPIGDDDRIRPSLFNDDQEFARLTEHDEQILKILYDPMIRPGMEEEEALRLALEIATRNGFAEASGRKEELDMVRIEIPKAITGVTGALKEDNLKLRVPVSATPVLTEGEPRSPDPITFRAPQDKSGSEAFSVKHLEFDPEG